MINVIEPQILADQNRGATDQELWPALGSACVARLTRGLNGEFDGPQPSWSALTGQSQTQLAGLGWLDAVHPDDRDRVRLSCTQTLNGNTLSYRLRDVSKIWRNVQEHTARFDGVDGLPPRTVTIVEDVGALYRTQQRLRLALVGGKIGTWDIDLGSSTMTCSDQCRANYGRLPGTDFSYTDLVGSIHPEDLDGWRQVVDNAITARSEFNIDYRTIWPDGSVHWVEVRGSCELDRQKNVVSLSGISIDVTAHKRAHQLDKERAQVAEAASGKKSEFLAILGHELRGPLGPISGALQAMKIRSESPKDREWLRALAERQVKHLGLLIDDLLDVARVERGEIRLQLAQIDLRAPLLLAIEAALPLIESRAHRFEQVGLDHPVTVEGDPTRVTQMVFNLLNNAAKYTPINGVVRIELSQQGNLAKISVIDNGIGLAANELERVFDMFQQVENRKIQSQGGLGIGLALTRQLVELHNGCIMVSSAGIDSGCQFTITLPLTQS